MEAEIVPSLIGFFALHEGKVVSQVLFPKDVDGISDRILRTKNGEIVDELKNLVGILRRKGYSRVRVGDRRLAESLRDGLGIEARVAEVGGVGLVRRNLSKFALGTGFVSSGKELEKILHGISVSLASLKTREALKRRDLLIIRGVETLENLDRSLNVLVSNVREWYGLYFPELCGAIRDGETLMKLISEIGSREGFTEVDRLVEFGLSKKEARRVARTSSGSAGAPLSDDDLTRIRDLCSSISRLYETRENLEHYLGSIMERVAPNLKTVVGALLGAKLISRAGGIDSLAKMPSSRIQVLGAEKALFRALRSGEGMPKHGIIFQHPMIHRSSRAKRGKLARALAAKVAIAARSDAFSGRFIGDELKARMEDLERSKK
ncbi:MAG: C/D box methylation guide ribonucleoprotein complex aNOP56 subunit [Candidatus Bathyarchaeia archaeon]